MKNQTNCSRLTQRGRPCRNRARIGSRPPDCGRHRTASAAQPALPIPALPVGASPRGAAAQPTPQPALQSSHFYFPNPTTAELRLLDTAGPETNLGPEVDLVRVVLRRLLVYLDEAGGELPPEELRRVAGLVFTGARTVALLAGKQTARPAGMEEWMSAALREMGEKYSLEL